MARARSRSGLGVAETEAFSGRLGRVMRLVVDKVDGAAVLARFVADHLADDEIPGVGSAVAAVPIDLGGRAVLVVDPRDPDCPLEVSVPLPADKPALDLVDRIFGAEARAALVTCTAGDTFFTHGSVQHEAPGEQPVLAAAGRLAVLDWARAAMPVPTEPALWALQETALACRAAEVGLDERAHRLMANLPAVVDEVRSMLSDDLPLWHKAAAAAAASIAGLGAVRVVGRRADECVRRSREILGSGSEPSGLPASVGQWSTGWAFEPGVLDSRERNIDARPNRSGSSLYVVVAAGPKGAATGPLWARAVDAARGSFVEQAPLRLTEGGFVGVIRLPRGTHAAALTVEVTADIAAPVRTERQRAVSTARRAAFRALFHERRGTGRDRSGLWWEAAAGTWSSTGLDQEARDARTRAAEPGPLVAAFLAELPVDPDLLDGLFSRARSPSARAR